MNSTSWMSFHLQSPRSSSSDVTCREPRRHVHAQFPLQGERFAAGSDRAVSPADEGVSLRVSQLKDGVPVAKFGLRFHQRVCSVVE